MENIEIINLKIKNAISNIFNSKDYPSFLSFASNFLSFSYKNIILIYLQAPDAKYVAGINAWKKITELDLKKNATPILVLYPYLSDKKLNYSIQKVFDYTQVDNEYIKEEMIRKEHVVKCDKENIFEGLLNYLDLNKVSAYPAENIKNGVTFDNNSNIIMYDKSLSLDEKMSKVIDVYIRKQLSDCSEIVKGSIVNSSIFMINKYYGLDVSRLNFKYIGLPVLKDEDKKIILEKSCSFSRSVVENIDGIQLMKMKSINDIER